MLITDDLQSLGSEYCIKPNIFKNKISFKIVYGV
jgi:hypothetical protein